MNGDASTTRALLGDGAPDQATAARSLSGFVLLVGLKRELAALAHPTVYFLFRLRAEFSQLFDERRFPDDPTVYVSAPSRSDRDSRPLMGRRSLSWLTPADEHAWDDHRIEEAPSASSSGCRGGFPKSHPT